MIEGSIVALITPFNPDGRVNFDKIGELLEWHIANKTDGILMLGTTSESPTMSHEEDDEICKFAVDVVNKRVPIIASSGSNCTKTVIQKSQSFKNLGADGLLAISPYYNKANNQGMYHHFADVADAVDLPMILYNVPGRTGCSIPVDVVKRLSLHKNIVGIKEASGDMSYAAKLSTFITPDFAIWSGNDDIILPILSLGGSGVISVLANIMPLETHQMVRDYLDGNIEKARKFQIDYMHLINDLFIEVNPIPVKEAMNLMGMGVGGYRMPLCPMGDDTREILRCEMERMDLI
ncbi:MAG: 4-hydroxy-tetrahydrodipicolinate synthase [Anaerovoracaceae bacterium]|jgi:4-hydroxy-tetrahydrodipicolinate synthase|nr:4-hydroxy-tetrahydrodipicolinate synthase [Anaerovoracaceae bacterium]